MLLCFMSFSVVVVCAVVLCVVVVFVVCWFALLCCCLCCVVSLLALAFARCDCVCASMCVFVVFVSS